MPYGITQCYLPPGRGDIPASTPAKAGTRFSDPGGMQGTNQKPMYDFLLVNNTNLPPILHHFQDMADIGQIFPSNRGWFHFNALAEVIPCEYRHK